jgi:two-component system, response regulator YesN
LRKYLMRLLKYSLLLGALPTVLIGIFSYYIATRDIEDKVKEGNMQLLSQTQMRVEQTLKSLEMSALQFTNSSLVRSAMNKPLSGEDFVEVREVMTEMFNLQTQAIINQSYLVNFDHDWAINLNYLGRLKDMEESAVFMGYARNPSGFFWSTDVQAVPNSPASPADAGSSGEDEKPVDTIRLIHKIPLLRGTTDPKGLLVLQIMASDIKGSLSPGNMLGSQYVLDKSGKAFLSTPREKADYAEINRQITARLSSAENKNGFFYSHAGGKKVGVTYRSSTLNGWSYVSVVSLSEITKETRKIAVFTALVCLLILLVVLAAAFFGSKRMYLPIRRLLEFTKGIEPSGGSSTSKSDELEFIRSSLDSLATSRNRLDQQMQGQTAHLKEFYVLKLFTGQMSDDNYMHRSRLYGFPADWRSLGVLTLQIDNLQETRFQEQDRELLLFAVNNMVAELLPESSRFCPILLNQSQVTLLASDTEDLLACKAQLYRMAETIRSKVEQYLNLQVSIGISRPYVHLSGTVKAYEESLTALKARISLGPDIIIHYEDVSVHSNSEVTVYSHLKLMEDQLVISLKELQPDKATEVLRQYMTTLLSRDGYHDEHHILLLQLVSRIIQIVQDQGVSVKKVLDGEGALERLLRLQTREEIILWFQSRLFAPVIRQLSDKAEHQYLNIAQRMVEIIHDHYDKELSLESCAAMMNFHPFYLSRVFKKEMGIPFSDYLSEYRMNAAKALLETTGMKVSEIGERMQYKNISAFIRTFRKTFGMTPGQYRETLEKK